MVGPLWSPRGGGTGEGRGGAREGWLSGKPVAAVEQDRG